VKSTLEYQGDNNLGLFFLLFTYLFSPSAYYYIKEETVFRKARNLPEVRNEQGTRYLDGEKNLLQASLGYTENAEFGRELKCCEKGENGENEPKTGPSQLTYVLNLEHSPSSKIWHRLFWEYE